MTLQLKKLTPTQKKKIEKWAGKDYSIEYIPCSKDKDCFAFRKTDHIIVVCEDDFSLLWGQFEGEGCEDVIKGLKD